MVECELQSYADPRSDCSGFNRYMVECEFGRSKKVMEMVIVLIDTWWNVNCGLINNRLSTRIVLIDTWWNVNNNTKLSEIMSIRVLIDTW